MGLHRLPVDVLFEIFSHMGFEDLASVELTCKTVCCAANIWCCFLTNQSQFLEVARDESLWERACHRKNLVAPDTASPPPRGWRNFFMEQQPGLKLELLVKHTHRITWVLKPDAQLILRVRILGPASFYFMLTYHSPRWRVWPPLSRIFKICARTSWRSTCGSCISSA
jgi:hypothetical protein